MTHQPARSPDARNALLFVGILTLIWALVPSLLFSNPPLDVVEGFAWGREMALGYTKHPPMQAWLLELSFRVTGGHVFGAYILSQLSIAATYGFIWALARRLGYSQRQAFWSLLLSSLVFYFTFPTPEFNPNVLQMPVWAGMIYLFHKALRGGKITDWILLGVLAAFGLYTKYFVALLIGAIGLYVLAVPGARRHLATFGPWLTIIVATALFAPHVAWIVETDFLTFRYAAARSVEAGSWVSHVLNPLNFLAGQVANHAALLLAVIAGFSIARPRFAFSNFRKKLPRFTDSDTLFLFWFALLPLAVLLLASAVTGNEFKQMWGMPMFPLSGLLAVHLLNIPHGSWAHPKRAFAIALVAHSVAIGALIGQATLEPYLKHKPTRLHFPGQEIAETLTADWYRQTGKPLTTVAGDMWSAAQLTLFSPDRPSMLLDLNYDISPWIDRKVAEEGGILIVWQSRNAAAAMPEAYRQRYPNSEIAGTRAFRYQTGADVPPVHFSWAIVPPAL